LGAWCSPARFVAAQEICAQTASDTGRSGVNWRHKYQPWVGLGPTREIAREHVASAMQRFYGVPFEAFEKYTPYGTPADVAEALSAYTDVGVREFDLSLCAADPDEAITLGGEVKRFLTA
jgi:hypothetical protein